MCTLIVSFRQHFEVPVVVAANRDEVRSRPATGPRRWQDEAFVAPRDEQAQGTWLGLTATGLFVGVTNRFPAERYPDRRSRGALVVDALRSPSASALHRELGRIDPRAYNAFHLLYADTTAAFVTWSDGAVLSQTVLEPGLHVVTERSLGGDDRARQRLIEERWPQLPTAGGLPTPEGLEALLASSRADRSGGRPVRRRARVELRHPQLAGALSPSEAGCEPLLLGRRIARSNALRRAPRAHRQPGLSGVIGRALKRSFESHWPSRAVPGRHWQGRTRTILIAAAPVPAEAKATLPSGKARMA